MARVDVASPTSSRAGSWAGLSAELDAWTAAGRIATFWWRDDDATRSGERLSRLLQIAQGTPLTLAVIPAAARDDLVVALDGHRSAGGCARAVQHGFAHVNHAPAGDKKAEYGPHRRAEVMLAELAEGRERLQSMFADMFQPIMTPPWNRIDPTLVPRLGEAGLTALSAFGARPAGHGPGTVNVHVDLIDWRRTRGFVGEAAALGAVADHLAARRMGVVDADEPTGLLTHHRDHDEACWLFAERLVAAINGHPAGRWTTGPATAAPS